MSHTRRRGSAWRPTERGKGRGGRSKTFRELLDGTAGPSCRTDPSGIRRRGREDQPDPLVRGELPRESSRHGNRSVDASSYTRPTVSCRRTDSAIAPANSSRYSVETRGVPSRRSNQGAGRNTVHERSDPRTSVSAFPLASRYGSGSPGRDPQTLTKISRRIP